MSTAYLDEFLMITLVHMLAVISPGPDFAIVIRQSDKAKFVSATKLKTYCRTCGILSLWSLHETWGAWVGSQP